MYICWIMKRFKDKEIKMYYGGYLDLKVFGLASQFTEFKEDAKKFKTQDELKKELKQMSESVEKWTIEKVE